jgi:hypothetical protein
MLQHIRIVAAVLCAAAPGMRADNVGVAGPASAVVFDIRSQSIRLVTGVPGASLLGATLADHIDIAEIAPNGQVALAVSAGQWYAISGLSSANPAWTQIAPFSQGIDRIVWNDDSSAAATYSSATRTLTFMADQTSIGLDSLPGDVATLALERSGNSAIVGVAGDAGGLYLVTPQNPPALLAPLSRPAAVSLIQDRDLLAVDTDTLQVFEVRDYHGTAELLPFASLPAGASKPVALAVSPDGQLVFAADQACQCVAVYQFSTRGLLDQVTLDAEPAFLKPLSNGRLFLMNAPSDSDTPFWILATGEQPSVYFVSGGAQ